MKVKIFCISLFLLLLSTKCSEEFPIEDVYVDIKFSATNANYYQLMDVGGYVYIKGGVKGIFVYNVNNQDYKAYDRCCPVDKGADALIYDDKLKCLRHEDTINNCNTRYSVILNGGAIYGSKGKFPLKEYKCINNKGFFTIYNDNFYNPNEYTE